MINMTNSASKVPKRQHKTTPQLGCKFYSSFLRRGEIVIEFNCRPGIAALKRFKFSNGLCSSWRCNVRHWSSRPKYQKPRRIRNFQISANLKHRCLLVAWWYSAMVMGHVSGGKTLRFLCLKIMCMDLFFLDHWLWNHIWRSIRRASEYLWTQHSSKS